MYRFVRSTLVLLCSVFCLVATAQAEVIIMKNGDRLEGTVLDKSDTTVKIKTKYGEIEVPQADIETIVSSPDEITDKADKLREQAAAIAEAARSIEDDPARRNAELQRAVELLEEARDIYSETRMHFTSSEYNFLDEAQVTINQEMKMYRDWRALEKPIKSAEPQPAEGSPKPQDPPRPKPVTPKPTPPAPAPEPAVQVGDGYESGLIAHVFRGVDLETQITSTKISHVDYRNADSIGRDHAGSADNFSVQFEGEIYALHTEEYSFITRSDDGVRLYVDDQRVIDNWTDHGTTEDRGTADLVEGHWHKIRLEFYERGGNSVIRLEWASDSQKRQIIPATHFRREEGAIVDPSALTFDSSDEAVAFLISADTQLAKDKALEYLMENADRKAFDTIWELYEESTNDALIAKYAQALVTANKKRAPREAIDNLDEDDWLTIAKALPIIKVTGDKKHLKRIGELFQNAYTPEQYAKIGSCLKTHAEESVTQLFEILEDLRDRRLQRRYIRIIGKMKHQSAVKGLIGALMTNSQDVVDAAKTALRDVGPIGFGECLATVKGATSSVVRSFCVDLLEQWSGERAQTKAGTVWVRYWKEHKKRIIREYDDYWDKQKEQGYPTTAGEFRLP